VLFKVPFETILLNGDVVFAGEVATKFRSVIGANDKQKRIIIMPHLLGHLYLTLHGERENYQRVWVAKGSSFGLWFFLSYIFCFLKVHGANLSHKKVIFIPIL
jgi:hypothetical protein